MYAVKQLTYAPRESEVRAPNGRGYGGITPGKKFLNLCDFDAFWRRMCGSPVSSYVNNNFSQC